MSFRRLFGSSPEFRAIREIESRLEVLEERLQVKKKELELSRAQKVLLLHELGLLDRIIEHGLSANRQAQIVALLLGTDESDIRKIIREVTEEDGFVRSSTNLNVVASLLKKFGLKSVFEKLDVEIDKRG